MKSKILVLGVALGFGLLLGGCGTTSCDDKGIATQALDILLQKYKKTSKELGFYANNVVLVDKDSNTCQAKVGIKAIDEIQKIIENKGEKWKEQKINENPFFEVGLVQLILQYGVLKLMGYDVSVNLDAENAQNWIVNAPKLEELSEINKFTQYAQILEAFMEANLHYRVTSNDKGDEYILAELENE